ncbi:hypothetical protein QEJ31_08510 [Pigmentibacter sp. JX0631]|uniref:hypothetical protein n=1 Tax=Pigmentibacter sp. JX0631 TaxID=2976982 RepID=UPI0024695C1C|nr:hypothetical protein [Pigmentibacter sp. JX0631]WGL58577.1 hypothetical protein QEJ31_08510 [Pigmentibacter sp. JX0631]
MKKLQIIFIIFFLFKINAYSFELTNSEKNIFQDNETIRVKQWNLLQSVNTKLEILRSSIFSISYLSNVADPNSKYYLKEKTPLGLNNDPIRVKINLIKAQDHMYLGDDLAAIEIVENELKNIDPRNRSYISWANKILFQANRMLKNHEKSTNICIKMLYIGGAEENLFPDKFKLACSNEFINEAMILNKEKNYESFKQKLVIWSNSPIIKNDSKLMVLSSAYIALSYRKIYSDNSFAIKYLQEAISHTKLGNNLIGRAYLVLALLLYENEKKEEALSLIRFLSGDFKGYGDNLKYFEEDESTKVLARLCLARFHASMFNLLASENWYRDVLEEENVTGFKLNAKEKIKVQLEFSHILYLQKKFKESAIEYKKSIDKISGELNYIFEENPQNRSNKVRISKFILAKILSKTEVKNNDSKLLLLELYGDVLADLEFLEKIKKSNSVDSSEQIENVLALSSLSEEYGIDSKLVTTASSFRKAYYNLENELRFIRSDLANAINVNDLAYSGILEARAVSSLTKVDSILDSFKDLVLNLDLLEFQLWDSEKSGSKFAINNRYELLKRLSSINDEISKYKLKSEIEDRIFSPKFPNSLKMLNNNINNLNAELSGLKFLFALNNNKVPEKAQLEDIEILEKSFANYSIDIMEEELVKNTIEERIFQISRSLKPTANLLFEKKYVILDETFKSIFSLHQKNKEKSYSIGEIEIDETMKNTWLNLFSTLKQLELTLNQVKDRIIAERKEVMEKINEINNHLLFAEKINIELNKKIIKEYNSISNELADLLFPRIKQFKDYINISLANYSEENISLSKEKNDKIKEAAEQRENWINSLKKSVQMDLMR